MKKRNAWLLIAILIIGGLSGYFVLAYQNRNSDAILSGDVTEKVRITCFAGNKEIISGKVSGLTFTKNDFDSSGGFIGNDKNAALQKVCGITNEEAMSYLRNDTNGGEEAMQLFEITMNR